MSGHSKWHNIQKTKGAADAKRGKIFTKIAREMIVAVKEGGGGDQFWDDSTKALLGALCFYLVECESKGMQNFSEVMKLLKKVQLMIVLKEATFMFFKIQI